MLSSITTPTNSLGINNNTKFTPSHKKTMDVVFVPENIGNKQIYSSLVYDDELNKYIPSELTTTTTPVPIVSPKNIYALPDGPTSQFFFGVITTIGLYIVYRFIEKSR
jgi:hypothetical protein